MKTRRVKNKQTNKKNEHTTYYMILIDYRHIHTRWYIPDRYALFIMQIVQKYRYRVNSVPKIE